jgi:hypothetical protein
MTAASSSPFATDPQIAKCWDAHVEAHNDSNIIDMAATYTDDCYICYYNVATGVKKEFIGVEGKMAFSKEHLTSLMMKDGTTTTNINVKNYFNGNTLFNQWNIKSDNYSYKDGADTFVFGGTDKLITHHYQWYFGTKLVESFGSPKECFHAHHEFVVAGDVTGVVNTFAEDCVISFFNTATNTRVEAKGHEEAFKLYTAFLKLLEGKEVVTAKGSEGGSGFNGATAYFAYKCEDAGITKANDVFCFSESPENKIKTLWTCYAGPAFDM